MEIEDFCIDLLFEEHDDGDDELLDDDFGIDMLRMFGDLSDDAADGDELLDGDDDFGIDLLRMFEDEAAAAGDEQVLEDDFGMSMFSVATTAAKVATTAAKVAAIAAEVAVIAVELAAAELAAATVLELPDDPIAEVTDDAAADEMVAVGEGNIDNDVDDEGLGFGFQLSFILSDEDHVSAVDGGVMPAAAEVEEDHVLVDGGVPPAAAEVGVVVRAIGQGRIPNIDYSAEHQNNNDNDPVIDMFNHYARIFSGRFYRRF